MPVLAFPPFYMGQTPAQVGGGSGRLRASRCAAVQPASQPSAAGHLPPTCPWPAMSSLVQGSGVISVVVFGLWGNFTSKWGMLSSSEERGSFNACEWAGLDWGAVERAGGLGWVGSYDVCARTARLCLTPTTPCPPPLGCVGSLGHAVLCLQRPRLLLGGSRLHQLPHPVRLPGGMCDGFRSSLPACLPACSEEPAWGPLRQRCVVLAPACRMQRCCAGLAAILPCLSPLHALAHRLLQLD